MWFKEIQTTNSPPEKKQKTTDMNLLNKLKKKAKKWRPLENNPVVLTEYMEKISGHAKDTGPLQIVEIMAFEDWAWSEDFIPGGQEGVKGLVFLYPITETMENFRREQEEKFAKLGDEDKQTYDKETEDLYFTKQTVGNACGTIALQHLLFNVDLGENKKLYDANSWVGKFMSKTAKASPDERADALNEDEEIETAHKDYQDKGSTQTISEDKRVDTHFIAFLRGKNGHLYEMDGRKQRPIDHGECDEKEILKKSVEVIQRDFMGVEKEDQRFSAAALVERR